MRQRKSSNVSDVSEEMYVENDVNGKTRMAGFETDLTYFGKGNRSGQSYVKTNADCLCRCGAHLSMRKAP
jgi:hypothetical protein